HQAEAAQIGKDLDNCLLCIFGFLAAGNDQFSRAEEKNYDLGVLKPVHKARELFGLVLDPVEIEPYSDLIEVDRCREIGRREELRPWGSQAGTQGPGTVRARTRSGRD